jgi:two-component system LytT family sensor kinase
MAPYNVGVLVHLLGFLTGAALYATLFGVAARETRRTADRLPLLTAILGLVWNLSGLAAFAVRDFAGREPDPLIVAIACAALGFLPAVVVHSVLRSDSAVRTRHTAGFFIIAAYGVSMVAASMLLWAARHGGGSANGLRVLTWSYAILTVPVLVLTRKRPASRGAWSILALAVFAVSALHLSQQEGAHEPLLVELLGHHASIPLIFAILYQDFRFALADLFLKRALAVFSLVAIASAAYVGIEVPLLSRHDIRSDPVAIGVSVITWVGIALLYPLLVRAAAWIVDRLVLKRVDYAALHDEIDRTIQACEDVEDVLDTVIDRLRGPLAAADIFWSEEEGGGAETAILIPTTEPPHFRIVVGRLRDGRRLLSDDEGMLRGAALAAARRIDAIRLEHERSRQLLREQDMSRLATEAELRALRAQVNPHFLFNALNTVGYLIKTSPARAEVTLRKLTSLLRGVLRSAGSAATLGDELELVSAYLDIERERFEERLEIEIDVDRSLRGARMPTLLIQPLVENAIKHGIGPSRAGGRISVTAHRQDNVLILFVRNTGTPTNEPQIAAGRRGGVGLANLEARLRQHYGAAARLTLTCTAALTTATVILPVAEAEPAARPA